MEIWWDVHIKTVPAVKHKPDIVVWEKDSKQCKIVDMCVPHYQNVHTQEKTKNVLYVQLAVALARMYTDHQYIIIPIVLGATILITVALVNNMKEL